MKNLLEIPFTKTSTLLGEQVFWKIINDSINASKNQDEQRTFLISEVEKLTPEEIIGFRLRTDKLLNDSYTSDLWCAAYIMNGGCSDDSFEYFRCWLISRGEEVYKKAIKDADSLAGELIESMERYDFELFWYIALDAFTNVTGKSLFDFMDNEVLVTEQFNNPPLEFTWNENDAESIKKICPRLYEKFNREV